jgi:glutathione S-transferase
MLKLYDLDRSGNCYKVRLLLSLVGLEYEKISIDANAGENKTEEFLALNPRGQLPVLEDDGQVLWDSTAILVYVAAAYAGDGWLPRDPYSLAAVMQYLALEQNEGRYGLARARAIALRNPTPFATMANADECRTLALTALEVLEARLRSNAWLVDARITIADVACYPYVALAPEGGISTEPFAGARAWLGRIESLPGYVPLPKARV